MPEHLSREQLKRNELGEAVEAGIHYAEGHLRNLILVLGGVVVLALGGWGIWAWLSSRSEAANQLLARALEVAEAEIVPAGANPDGPGRPTFASASARDTRAQELFTDLDRRYGSASVGRVAKLYLAEGARAGGDRATARRLWEEYLEADPDSPVAAAVRVNLFALDREEGKSEQLAESLKKMLEDPARPLPADLLLFELARTYEALGRGGDAKAAYRRIVDEHPQSPYLGTAQREAGVAPVGG